MPIRQDDNQPNRRFGIVNIILIGVGALLLFSSLFPNQNMQIPRVPYSLFIDQVNDGEVKRAYITQEQIRYELNGAEEGAPSVLATTPIFDMDLPQRLESKGVEFAAAPPKKPNFFSTILSWVVPPLIFILVLQFFARRSMGGGGAQGALSFTKSKAKVYVPDDESKVTFADVAGVDEAKDELTEIVDFLIPKEYSPSRLLIPILIGSAILTSSGNITGIGIMIAEKTHLYSVAAATGFIVNITITIPMILSFGMLGAVTGTFLSSCIYSWKLTKFSKLNSGFNISTTRPIRIVILYLLISILFIFTEIYAPLGFHVRLLLLIPLISAFFLLSSTPDERSHIIAVVKNRFR